MNVFLNDLNYGLRYSYIFFGSVTARRLLRKFGCTGPLLALLSPEGKFGEL